MSGLIPLESINAVEVFTGGKLDELLASIRKETASIVPDISTVAGRKAIASLAYSVARSKTTIDDAGKSLVAEWKKQAGAVDDARKKARDYLDALRDEVRKPLDDYEAEQARIEAAKLAEEARIRQEAEDARLAELARREAELKAREEAIAEAERAEAAKREAAAAIEREREAAEARRREELARQEREAIEAAARKAREEEHARIDAERAERRRIEDAEREAAAKKLREEQEATRIERERLDREAKEAARKAKADAIAAATLHSAAAEALDLLIKVGQGEHLTTQKLAAALNRENSKGAQA